MYGKDFFVLFALAVICDDRQFIECDAVKVITYKHVCIMNHLNRVWPANIIVAAQGFNQFSTWNRFSLHPVVLTRFSGLS